MNTPTQSAGENATKHAINSKTILGLLMMALSWANARFDWGLGGPELEQTVSDVGTMLGLALGVWGRLTARKGLTLATEQRARMWIALLICMLGACMAFAGCVVSLAYDSKTGAVIATVEEKLGEEEPGKEVLELERALPLPRK